MEDIDFLYRFLKEKDFNRLEFKNSDGKVYETIKDCKLFVESEYNAFCGAKNDQARQTHYNNLLKVYNQIKDNGSNIY